MFFDSKKTFEAAWSNNFNPEVNYWIRYNTGLDNWAKIKISVGDYYFFTVINYYTFVNSESERQKCNFEPDLAFEQIFSWFQ